MKAGCGTGNYSIGFLKEGIGKLTMVDASAGMLFKAREKVSEYSNVVEIKKVVLPKLSYEDNSFDAVALIQVLHHLDRLEDTLEAKYPAIEATIWEANRVLKPNGVLLVDTIFSKSHEINPIYLAPKAFEIWKKRYCHENFLIDFIKENKFVNLHYLGRPNCTFFANDAYFDRFEILMNPELHNTISSLRVIEETGELNEVMQLVRTKIEDGTIDQLRRSFTRKQRTLGCHTTVYAQKPVIVIK